MDVALENRSLLSLRPRTAVLSIAGFWTFYCLIATIRSAVIGQAHPLALFGGRVAVIVVCMAVSFGLFCILSRIPTRSLSHGVIAIALLAAPSAVIYTIANDVAFDWAVHSQMPASSQMVQVGMPAMEDPHERAVHLDAVRMTADNVINSYFFFSAWGALYLALCYAAEVGALERRNAQFRAAAQSAELRALRYQINPHFLFNTLNALSSLIMTGKRDIAERMILNLSHFFRTSLNDDPTHDVRLSEEIRLQQLYLAIEQVRFADRLMIDFAVPAELEDACVPGLILQPLIENAVKHGVARSRRPVTLRVRAEQAGQRLTLTVENDGDASDDGAPEAGTGVGLRNVRDRLFARYEAAATCGWEYLPDGGFKVVLRMPLVRDGC